jgi:hypothetical protein
VASFWRILSAISGEELEKLVRRMKADEGG